MVKKLIFPLMFFLLVACVGKPGTEVEKSHSMPEQAKGQKKTVARIKVKEILPTLTPVPSTPEQEKLIAEGTKLHDKGRYGEALDRYGKVLKQNPDNVHAMMESAFTLFEMGDYEKSLEFVKKALRYKTPLRGHICIQAGNTYDALGKPEIALYYYRKAVEFNPEDYLAYFNAGITLARVGEKKKALNCFKKAVVLNPKHASSNFMLASQYYEQDCIIPAILAYSRFLILEPNTDRSDFARKAIQSMVAELAEEKKDKTIKVKVKEDPTFDGDFNEVKVAYSIIVAARFMKEEVKFSNEYDRLAWEFDSLFSFLKDFKQERGFVWQYYAPFFVSLHEKGYAKPFVIVLYYKIYPDGARVWLSKKENDDLFQEFYDWCFKYNFPKMDVRVDF